MSIDIALIQKLRAQTGAGLSDVKSALEEANGDEEKAIQILRSKGAKAAAKRADRETTEGLVHPYIHSTGKIGAMVALGSETDFVARNDQFKELANDIALHIVAEQPEFLSPEEIPSEVKEERISEITQALKEEGKPEDMIEKIVEGKMNKWFEEVCLLNQKFIKDEDITIKELIEQKIGTIGEKIEIHGFSLLQI